MIGSTACVRAKLGGNLLFLLVVFIFYGELNFVLDFR